MLCLPDAGTKSTEEKAAESLRESREDREEARYAETNE